MEDRSQRRHRSKSDPPRTKLTERFSITSLLLFGLILGLAGGLYYAWIVSPVMYVDASPARLSDAHKEEYIFLVSQSYAVNGNRERAERRLASLDDATLPQTLVSLLETYLRQQRPAAEVSNLALLARDFGGEGPAVALFAPTPLAGVVATETPTSTPIAFPTPTETATPRPTQTPLPTSIPTSTRRPSPTPLLVFRLLSQQRLCPSDASRPLIEVETQDALLNPLPGVEVSVSWDGGTDHFFTGFKPETGPGYGDFTMSPDVSYTVVLAEGSPEVSGLRIISCDNGLEGGWSLTFQNLVIRSAQTPEP